MKRRFPRLAVLIALFALSASAAWAGNAKVQVCHIPPGNPSNFHTITISENALQAHLGHGDLAGACFAHCDTLCSDGNPCTIDACNASEQCLSTHPPVNCDDGLLCTTDSCNPVTGCASVPTTCSDGDNCTINACDPLTGSCVAPPVVCPDEQSCNPDNGECGEIVCPCVGEIPDFDEALDGQFGLTSCQDGPDPVEGLDIVTLTTGDGRGVGTTVSTLEASTGLCGVFSGTAPTLIISDADRQICNALVREKAATAGLTCTPF